MNNAKRSKALSATFLALTLGTATLSTNNLDAKPEGPTQFYNTSITTLKPYPTIGEGERTPFDLWRYSGKGASSYAPPTLPMRFDAWVKFHEQQKPVLMRDVQDYMNTRYDFSGKVMPGVMMSGGRKAVMQGPVARLPEVLSSWEELARLSPEDIRQKDLFPFKPLAHPLQSTAHMVFHPAGSNNILNTSVLMSIWISPKRIYRNFPRPCF